MFLLQQRSTLRLFFSHFSFLSFSFLTQIDKWPRIHSGMPSTAGTTASIAFIRKGKLYVGHCGDSGIVMGYRNPDDEYDERWLAHPLTIDHKPELEEELERIESCGGKVIDKAGVNRVVWFRPMLPVDGFVRRNTKVEHVAFLAVARSLGDLWSYNVNTQKFVVSPEPDVSVHVLDPRRHKYLIFATDGLWNMRSMPEAVDLAYEAEMRNAEYARRGSNQWQNPAQFLVANAMKRWQDSLLKADNTTVICVAIDELNFVPTMSRFTRGIYDHDTNEAYNLDYIDPFHIRQNDAYPNNNPTYGAEQVLPSLFNAGYAQLMLPADTSPTVADPISTRPPLILTGRTPTNWSAEAPTGYNDLKFYTNAQRPGKAFIQGCCPGQRFVLAANDEMIPQHESPEHHRQVYDYMALRMLPPLHYTYRAVVRKLQYPIAPKDLKYYATNLYDVSVFNPETQKIVYLRPSERDFREMHEELSPEEIEDEERVRKQKAFAVAPFISDTDEGDSDDDDEMQWSDEEMGIQNSGKLVELITEPRKTFYEASDDDDDDYDPDKQVYTQQKPVEEDSTNDSIQIFEISSSSNLVAGNDSTPPRKSDNKPLRKLRSAIKPSATKVYQTRSRDRQTRATRVIGRKNSFKKRGTKVVKKVGKALSGVIIKKLKISTNVKAMPGTSSSSKNKENNNAEKSAGTQGKAKAGKRVLRSSQTDIEEMPVETSTASATKNVMNVAHNLRSHAIASSTTSQKQKKSLSSKTRKRSNKAK